MEFETLGYEESDGVGVVTLDRPEVHNAFNDVMQRELCQVWRSLRTNDEVRAIVLTGSGTKAFCTGIDRADVPTDESSYDFHPLTYEDPGRSIGPRSQGLWKPVIAAVNGMACGGAFYLLGQADFLIAADHTDILRSACDVRHAGCIRTGAHGFPDALRRSDAHDPDGDRRTNLGSESGTNWSGVTSRSVGGVARGESRRGGNNRLVFSGSRTGVPPRRLGVPGNPPGTDGRAWESVLESLHERRIIAQWPGCVSEPGQGGADYSMKCSRRCADGPIRYP